MVDRSRRDVMKVGGALLGGIAVGSTVTAAESTSRFFLEAKNRSASDVEAAGLDVVFDLSDAGYFVVEGAESDVERTEGKYAPDVEVSFDGAVERVDADVDAASATDEPLYGFQWDKQVQDVPTAHEKTRGEGARVAIIDSGVGAGHPDLEHAVNEDLSQNFTGDGLGAANPAGGYHGTHVAGIVAANDRNETGVVGTAPGAEIVDCRVFSPSSSASFASILAAVAYSAEIGCDVANLSIGAYPVPRQGEGSFYGKVVNKVMTYANSQGTLLTISTGNDAADLQHDKNVISLPNEGAQAVGVSATGPVGFGWGDEGLEEEPNSPANYTNYGTNAVTVSAPGGDYDPDAQANEVPGWHYDLVLNAIAVPQFADDGEYLGAAYDYSWVAGTSMAAPQVAGAAALVKSKAPDLNANQVESRLKQTASDAPGGKEYHGSGFVNPVGALEDL
ncbi:S8 family serine peptidase [Halorubellus sp. JP-L1]|uniref:S8 family peptidase n=1 Tax=Halorubellus sp. JP-L1 TaxID=2715753 RepID=UPI00140894DA|nr:S8 family serine peptidase [Halorubellus sp. JP-L1]NHN40419.1 S8 family serine peptidase [Halorubellus sp. JP-L1]